MWFYTHQLQHNVLFLFTLQFPWIVLAPGIPAKGWINYSETPSSLYGYHCYSFSTVRGFYLSVFILCLEKKQKKQWEIILGTNTERRRLRSVPLHLFPSLLPSPLPSAPHLRLPVQSHPFISCRWSTRGRGGGGSRGGRRLRLLSPLYDHRRTAITVAYMSPPVKWDAFGISWCKSVK